MIFKMSEIRQPVEFKSENKLSMEDLLNDFSINSNNRISYPIAKLEHEYFNFGTNQWEITTTIVDNIKDIRWIKCDLDRSQTMRLLVKNTEKYILGYENIQNRFPYHGSKALNRSKKFVECSAEQQKYFEDNNIKTIVISHEDCGYPYYYRCSDIERSYSDFVCDGTNDTEILQNAINMYPDDYVCILLHEDQYTLKPTSGSGTDDDPYICLNIDRDNIIIRSCDRKTNLTYDKNIVNPDDKIYLIKSTGNNVDISTINFALEELDIHYVEYAYPDPTEKMIEVKNYVESINPTEKLFTKDMVLDLINSDTND